MKFVTTMIASRAAASPHALAVAGAGETLTYDELECGANRLAHKLQALGIRAEEPIGLMVDRSPAVATGALGILKAGGAYLPLDPALPAERLAFMRKDAGVRFIVSSSKAACEPPCSCASTKLVSLDAATDSGLPAIPPPCALDDRSLAYIIYTSGSTGAPKAVLIEHGSLANLIAWHNAAFAVTAAVRASHISSIGFDAAVWELWPYLAAGASVHFVDEFARKEPEALRDWLCANRITIGFAPTALAEHLLDCSWPEDCSLHTVLTGADTLHRRPTGRLPFVLINNYGPTECTVVATSGAISSESHTEGPPTIGAPIANTVCRVLDATLRPVPPGETGELHIGGAGVARGYLNRPELTAEKFIHDPFSDDPAARLYRTGDLVRQLPGGELSFVGRIDNQIKVRGFRIEPEEIAAALARHSAVTSALVAARLDAHGETRLIAWMTASNGARPADALIEEYLRGILPTYMIPGDFVWLDEFPLTANGKVDQAALPNPAPVAVESASGTESRLSVIIAGLLRVPEVRPNDNFFLMGGHSLLGAQMIARIRDVFGVQLALRNLFESPTPASLAATIDAQCVCTAAAGAHA